MNVLSSRWFSEQETEENNIIQQIHMNSILGGVHESQYTLPQSFPTNIDPSYDDLMEMKPSKIVKTTYILPKLPPPPSNSPLPTNSKPHLHHHHQPSSTILSFENAGSSVVDHEYPLKSIFSPIVEANKPHNQKSDLIVRKGTKRSQPLTRCQSSAQDHILAERKRREKLTQRFVALSALVPGLKKMDKASVLGDALIHIKSLQGKVQELEEQKKERRLESMVLVKKSKLILDDNNQSSSSSSSSEHGSSSLNLPEIEVRFSDKDVLIKILCEKQKGHIAKIMAEIEKFPFLVTNSSVLPFGPTLDITIVAKKENDFDMTLMDVVKNLKAALSKFM